MRQQDAKDQALGNPFSGMSVGEVVAHKMEASSTMLEMMGKGEIPVSRQDLLAIAREVRQEAMTLRRSITAYRLQASAAMVDVAVSEEIGAEKRPERRVASRRSVRHER